MTSGLAIVTGSDATYFGLLRGLVLAIRETPEIRDTPIYVFDAGLSAEQRSWLAARGAALSAPRWSFPRAVPGYIAMLAARPSIPDYFPGHDVYLWFDADAWPQRFEAVATYRRDAFDKGFAVTPEVHPAYNNRELAAAHKRIRAWYGPDVETALAGTAPINLGVFAGAAGAPHWSAWRRRVDNWLSASTSQEVDFSADQTAFNMVVHADRLDTALLPARYNWICHTAVPKVSVDGLTLLEPTPPYAPLGVIHMTLWTKKGSVALETPNGGKLSRPLTYRGEPLPENGKSLPDFALTDLDTSGEK